MNKSTKEILDNFFTEAESGLVYLQTSSESSPWKFGVHFFTNIEGNSNAIDSTAPELQIPNYKVFIEHIDDYLKLAYPFYFDEKEHFDLTDESYTKKLIADLFASATNIDFQDFYSYLKTRTTLLQNTLPQETFELGTLNNALILASMKKNPSNLEGPYNMELFAQKAKEIYPLPSVTFGIADNNLYVYAVKYTNTKSTDPITKKTIPTVIDGKPVLDTPFKQNMQEFFHSITQNSHAKGAERNISPTALSSLSLFLSFFKGSGIKEVIAPNFMPIRYETNRSAVLNKPIASGSTLDEKLEKHDNNQSNITNKFMHLFLRYNRSFPECEIKYDDLRQEMHMKLSPTKSMGENLIYQIDQVGNDTVETLSK